VPTITPINFQELVNDVTEAIKFLPEYENIQMITSITQTGLFESDVMKLRIIFNNLITNAVKFQDNKKEVSFIKLTINATSENTLITFEDNGLGIKKEDLEKIFKMFYRAGATNSGSGIGLYIVHEAINKLEGKIKVTSTLGEGSIFEINIPSINK
jgi:signal transduction histidine kinase